MVKEEWEKSHELLESYEINPRCSSYMARGAIHLKYKMT